MTDSSDDILTQAQIEQLKNQKGGIEFGAGSNFISGGNLPNIDYGDIAGQIFAQQPRDLGNLGVDLNANRDALDALVDAGLVDLGSMGIMGAMPSMGGSAPAITEQAQINAAQTYANLVLGPQPTTAEQFADIEKAKQALIDLNVSREQIEAATVTDIFGNEKSVDTSRGISGVMGPTVGGALGSVADTVIDKYGTGALKALDAYTSLFGYDADGLLKDSSVAFNPLAPGATYIFGDEGNVATTRLGTTPAGNPVVLGGPIGAAGSVLGGFMDGDIGILDLPGAAVDAVGGLGGAVQTVAGALNVADDTESKDKVTLDTTGVLGPTSDSDGSDKTKTTTPASDTGSVATKTDTTTSIKDTPSVVTETGLTPIDDPFKGEKTSVVKTGEEVKTSTPASGGVGGVGGLPAGGGGTGTISGGPGPLVDIDYLYDMAGSLAQPFLSTEDEDEEDLKVYAKGGGHVKKFSTGMNVGKSAQDYFDATAGKTGGKFSFRDFIDQNAKTIAGGLVGGLLGISDDSGGSGPVGYQGGIPDYDFDRKLKDNAFSNVLDAQGNRINPLAATETSTMRRPGSMGRSYFDYGDELFTGTGTMQGVGLPSLVETDTTATTTTGLPAGLTYTPVSDVDTTEGALGGAGAVDTGIGAVRPTPTPETETPDTPLDTPLTPDTPPTRAPTAYELLEADGDYTPEEVSTVVRAIQSGEIGTGNVAEKFNVGETEIYANLLRQGAYTPAELANYIATEGNDPTYTEQDLIVRLLQDGLTTPEEVADYYKVEVDSVKENFKKLGGTRELAQGGPLNNYYLGGPTDGMADLIPASIDGTQPAALSDGEFVIPADVVSHLGNGNSDAGANQLMSMMDRVRNARTGTTKQGTEINPTKMMPA